MPTLTTITYRGISGTYYWEELDMCYTGSFKFGEYEFGFEGSLFGIRDAFKFEVDKCIDDAIIDKY